MLWSLGHGFLYLHLQPSASMSWCFRKVPPESWLFSRIQIKSSFPFLPWPLRTEHSYLSRQPRAQRSALFISLELSASCLTPECSFQFLHTGHKGFPWPDSHVPIFFMLHIAFTFFQIDIGGFSSRKPLYPIFTVGWLIGLLGFPVKTTVLYSRGPH